ncbi:MAG: aminotransferase class I/II-fold pyridoxal phosphate-dependent enzyme [Acidobacteria bacterium]|nr:aminotransferase class I/II-fold pyridoxal phosphate-dependent enzyme [Acidobacteriota bacterium]
MKKDSLKLETKIIHSGEPEPRIDGAVSMPIFQTAMFEYAGETSYHDVRYIRLNNTPNHIVLSKKLAALEGGESAQIASSGMAAITTAFLTLLKTGDHLLAQNCLYGGTHDFVTKDLEGFGISYDFIDGNDPSSWLSKLKPNTKAIYVEAMSNPLLEVADLKATVEFARKHNLVSMIDNTFASPINFRASEFGFDITLHSCTKYLNGHSDLVAGAIIGSKALVEKITHKLNHLGGSLDPHAVFLLHRGVKTLALRVKHQNESALKIAQFLASHPKVAKVNYPGLETHPNYQRAKELFNGFSGMMSFELKGGVEVTTKFIKNLTIPVKAPSLGGVETLVTLPSKTSHAGLSKEDREKIGISDSLIRLSVGIEATEDLILDFEQALES